MKDLQADLKEVMTDPLTVKGGCLDGLLMILKVEGLRAGYGGSEVLHGVSIEVGEDEVVSIIGPNGAGKSTLLLTIAGIVRPLSGRVTYMREEITSLPVHERVRKGLVLCPERRRLFPEMTVGENVMAGAYLRNDREGIRKDLEKVFEIFPFIRDRCGRRRGPSAAASSRWWPSRGH